MKRSFSASDIRARNFRLVFELARLNGEVLRPEISAYTGMTPPTVMKVVQSYLSRKILINAGEVDTEIGRKPMKLVFNPNAAHAIGILFEGDELRAGLVNLSGEIVKKIKISMLKTFTSDSGELIVDIINQLTDNSGIPILGVGLGLPGVVNTERNIIYFAPLIGITKPTDYTNLCMSITEKTNLPVVMDNDVNLAAVGEFATLKLTNKDDLLYIAIGTGVGAGIMLDGRLRRGPRYLTGEFGYTIKDTRYKVDQETPGWLESQIGQAALMEKFQWLGYGNTNEIPDGLIEYLVENLSPHVANLATQLDLMRIVIGGKAVDSFGEQLLKELREKIDMLSLESTKVSLPMSSDSGVAGAAMSAIEENLNQWLTDR